MRRHVHPRTIGLVLLAGVLGALTGSPAVADDTGAEFTLLAGTLGISVPTSADLGSVPVGSPSVSGSLGTVTVTDTRGALTAVWSATASSTDFTTGGASANETVAKSSILYTTGSPTGSSGTGAFTPTGGSLTAAVLAGAWLGVGNNSVSWNPTITVTLLPGKVAGTYTGVITHSVA
jgi:hypothetical protein